MHRYMIISLVRIIAVNLFCLLSVVAVFGEKHSISQETGLSSLEFNGFAIYEDRTLVSIRSKSFASSWFEVGDTFSGFVLDSFDEKSETVTITLGDASIQLSLKNSEIKSFDQLFWENRSNEIDVGIDHYIAHTTLKERRKEARQRARERAIRNAVRRAN